ncbi:bZIP transcription factor 1 [Phytophthora citrophthora]|uniref:BZIP transcription factor 1 n=1 Tax=Phytophthora citrophthora TaxID=4793 RepID=A0AAD9LCA2_9STRA|nr:bZIP transcription factor 1 [Phytophthora citrophthora]
MSAAKREQSRMYQTRYRSKQRQHVEGLHVSINELEKEIQELTIQREELERCSPVYTSIWTVASEYFRVFRYGFKAPMIKPMNTTLAVRPSENQMNFLLRAMAPGVTDAAVSGVDEILENWRKLSIYPEARMFSSTAWSRSMRTRSLQ